MHKGNNTLEGELKIISRTQSEMLQHYLNTFFKIWSDFEREYKRPGWTEEDGVRWIRVFCFKESEKPKASDDIAEEMTRYIRAIDEGLGIYFSDIEAIENSIIKIYEHYKSYLRKSTLPF